MRSFVFSFALVLAAACGKSKPDPYADWPKLERFAGEFFSCAEESQTPWVVDDPLALVEMGLPLTPPAHVMAARCKKPIATWHGFELEILYAPDDRRIFQIKGRSEAEFFDGLAHDFVHVLQLDRRNIHGSVDPKYPKLECDLAQLDVLTRRPLTKGTAEIGGLIVRIAPDRGWWSVTIRGIGSKVPNDCKLPIPEGALVPPRPRPMHTPTDEAAVMRALRALGHLQGSGRQEQRTDARDWPARAVRPSRGLNSP